MPPSYCTKCGTQLRLGNRQAGTTLCYDCYSKKAAMQQTAIQPIEDAYVTSQPAERPVYAQPVPGQPTVYGQPQAPQTLYEEARATGHPVYEQPQPAAQGQPTTQINQTFVTHQPQQVPMPMYSAGDRKNPGVAAILSFFWAGLGQIYNGQLAKGIGFIVLYAFSVLLLFVGIGLILVPLVWIIGIWDAYSSAKSYNERQLQNEMAYQASLMRR